MALVRGIRKEGVGVAGWGGGGGVAAEEGMHRVVVYVLGSRNILHRRTPALPRKRQPRSSQQQLNEPVKQTKAIDR